MTALLPWTGLWCENRVLAGSRPKCRQGTMAQVASRVCGRNVRNRIVASTGTYYDMTEIEQEPAPVPSKPPIFQYTLRTLFVLTGITAVLFSVVCTLGYADAIVVLAAVLVLVCITRYPHRVHRITSVVMTIIAGALLWLNLRPTRWQERLYENPPEYLDPVSNAVFYRGWPVGPWMICDHQNLSVRHGGGGAVPFDGLFYAVAIVAVRGVCESYFRRRFWLSWIAYGSLILSLFSAALACDLHVRSAMRSPYGPDLLPVYVLFAGVIVLVVGLAFGRVAGRTNERTRSSDH